MVYINTHLLHGNKRTWKIELVALLCMDWWWWKYEARKNARLAQLASRCDITITGTGTGTGFWRVGNLVPIPVPAAKPVRNPRVYPYPWYSLIRTKVRQFVAGMAQEHQEYLDVESEEDKYLCLEREADAEWQKNSSTMEEPIVGTAIYWWVTHPGDYKFWTLVPCVK